MQIAVNTRLLLANKLDGIGWFSYQTLKLITSRHPEHQFVFLFDRDFDESFVFSDNITPLIVGPQARHPVLYYAWFQFSVKSILNRLKPDLFLSPDGFLSLGATSPQLPVIHDINFLHHPRDSKWLTAKYYNHFFPKFAREAKRIATVSEYSKQDIAKNYRIDPARIDVVYNGINSFFRQLTTKEIEETRRKFAYGKPYFLSVGSLHPRKNIVNLVKGFARFKKETSSDIRLLLAGPGFWGLSDIHNTIDESGVKEDIVFTGRLNDGDLAQVMGSALALTFVPYYEGFGIPVIEAFEAGIPVITNNVTSLPEVAGDAALFCDPFNIGQIADRMKEIQNEDLKKELVQKGFRQKEKFSWDKSADLLWKSIERSVAGSSAF